MHRRMESLQQSSYGIEALQRNNLVKFLKCILFESRKLETFILQNSTKLAYLRMILWPPMIDVKSTPWLSIPSRLNTNVCKPLKPIIDFLST